MEKKLTIKEYDKHFINADLSIDGNSFNLILVCTSDYKFIGCNWHLVIPNWNVACPVGVDKIYNAVKLEENVPAEDSPNFEPYIESIAETIVELIKQHDSDM